MHARHTLTWLGALLALGGLVACGGSSGGGSGAGATTDPNSVTAMVSPGGSIQLPDGTLKLTIPSTATASAVQVNLTRLRMPTDGTDEGIPEPPYTITLSTPVQATVTVDTSAMRALGFSDADLAPDFNDDSGALDVAAATVTPSGPLNVDLAPVPAPASASIAAASAITGQVTFGFGVGTWTLGAQTPIPATDWTDNTAESFRLPIGDNGVMDNGTNLTYLVRTGDTATFTQPSYKDGDTAPKDWAVKSGGQFLADGSTGYKAGYVHYGVDWNLGSGSTDLGMPIHGVANGVVLYDKVISTGARVIGVLHTLPDGTHVVSDYEHAQYGTASTYAAYPEVPKRWHKGDVIHKGDILGFIGDTGAKGAVHLHFSLIKEDPGNLDGLFVHPTKDSTGTVTDWNLVRVTGGRIQKAWSYPYKEAYRQAIVNSFDSPLDYICPGSPTDVRVVGILNNPNNPSYFNGTNTNAVPQYENFLAASTTHKFVTKVIDVSTSTPLWPEIWKRIDVLLLPDNAIPDDQVSSFLVGFQQARGSKGLVAADSGVTVLDQVGLLGWANPGSGMGTDWDYYSNASDLVYQDDPAFPMSFPVGTQTCVQGDARLLGDFLPSDFHVLAAASGDPKTVYIGYRDLNAPGGNAAWGRVMFLGPFDASFFPVPAGMASRFGIRGSGNFGQGRQASLAEPLATVVPAETAASHEDALRGIIFDSLR